MSGYQNPEYSLNLREGEFSTHASIDNLGELRISLFDKSYKIANLHIHSKEPVCDIGFSESYWKNIIEDANTGFTRISETLIPDLIHSKKISLRGRYLRAKRIGFLKQIKRSIRSRIS